MYQQHWWDINKKKKKSNFPLLIITQLKVIWLSGDVICRGLDVPDSTWEKKWSVWWGWSRQDGTAMWCDPEDSERAGRRALSQYFFKTMDPDPFTGMTVYSFLFQQRKADKHYTGLGGCSSWQRPEQSRWSQQVRWAKNAFFFSFLYSVFSLHSASCASQSAVMFSIFLLCSKCFYSIHQPQKASVVRRCNGNVNWMQVTHKRCITVISITKGRRTAVTAELGYLFEAGRCHDGGFDLYYSLDFTHRGTTGLHRPWPSIVMHGFLLFSFFHWLGHSRTGVASKSLLCRRFSWMRDCWWRITVFTLVSFITRGIGEQIVWSGDGFAWCVLLKSSR